MRLRPLERLARYAAGAIRDPLRRPAKPSTSTIIFCLLLVGGLALRILALRTGLARQNSDTSIVYLMSQDVAEGDFRVFYWGQQYGGTMLQLTAGMLFRLVGSSFVGLQFVEIGFWLLACLLLRSIVVRAGGVFAGNVAACLFWLGTPYMVAISFSDPGFYGNGLVVGLAAIRIAQGAGESMGWARTTALGVCLGLALWTTPLALALALPAALWKVARVRSAPAGVAGITGMAVGAAPWLWANLHTGLASLERQQTGAERGGLTYWHFFTELVPGIAGFGSTSTQGRVVAALFLLTPLLGGAIALWKGRATIAVLCLSALLVPVVVAASGVLIVPEAARYATFGVPAVAGVLGWAASRVRAVGVLAILLVTSWTVITIWHSTNGLRPVNDPIFGVETLELGKYLEKEGRTAVWADYWVSYLLTAATEERVTAAALAPPVYRREPSYEADAMRPQQTTVVLFAEEANDLTLNSQTGLPPYERTLVGPFAVWVFARRMDPSEYLTALPGA